MITFVETLKKGSKIRIFKFKISPNGWKMEVEVVPSIRIYSVFDFVIANLPYLKQKMIFLLRDLTSKPPAWS